jgi:hypothetical protein
MLVHASRALLPTLLTATVLGVSACGGDSDEDQIEGAVVSFSDASREKDAAKFCDVVIVEPILKGMRCEDLVSGISKEAATSRTRRSATSRSTERPPPP